MLLPLKDANTALQIVTTRQVDCQVMLAPDAKLHFVPVPKARRSQPVALCHTIPVKACVCLR